MDIKFSVIIPTYNRAYLISETIQSVLDQSYKTWELIIIDDGSTDNTKEVVAAFNDQRIRYIYQENAERSAARNNGISNATGEWICFLDSDDKYLTEHLESISTLIVDKKIEPGVIITGLTLNNEGVTHQKPLLNIQSENILKEIWTKFIIPTQSVIHKSILNENKFDVRYRLWEDTHLFLRILSKYPLYQSEKYTCVQKIHEEGTVITGFRKIKLNEVAQYVNAINDLKTTYAELLAEKISNNDFKNYIDLKYRMYLYQARQNKQLAASLRIWFKAILNSFSFYLLKELPVIFINKVGIGIYGK